MTENLNDGTDLFDPTDSTVAEVRDYLAAATADEVGRVKAVEEGGKARAGVLSWEPEKPSAPKDGGDGYTRVPVEDPYPAGEPAAWGHNGQDEGKPGSDTPVEIPED